MNITGVVIGSRHIPVQRVSAEDIGGDLGHYTNNPAPIIQLDKRITGTMWAATLLHECLHAIADLYGLPLRERDVLTLENTILSLLRDNPELAWVLCDEHRKGPGDADGNGRRTIVHAGTDRTKRGDGHAGRSGF